MNGFRDLVRSNRPCVVAHRGDSMHAPENTLEAASRGHQAGADAWELDVRLTRDRMPVVFHDDSLLRTTNVAERFADDPRRFQYYRVADFDWSEIQTLDAGSWFVAEKSEYRSARYFRTRDQIPEEDLRRFQSGEVRIPSLAQALDLTQTLDWHVNIELKTFHEGGPGLAEAVAAVVLSRRMSDRVLISAFDHKELVRIRPLLPEVALGALTMTPLHNSARYVREIVGADTYHPSAEALGSRSLAYQADPRPENLWSEGVRDVPTFVYTVNKPDLAQHLGAIGVAGLFSDDPGGVLRLWQDQKTGNEEQQA